MQVTVGVNRFALKALREKDDKSVPKLAGLAKISREFLYRLEAGDRDASPEVRERLAVALNVPTKAIEAQLIEVVQPAMEDVAA
jgi:predicted transcriptional regulator